MINNSKFLVKWQTNSNLYPTAVWYCNLTLRQRIFDKRFWFANACWQPGFCLDTSSVWAWLLLFSQSENAVPATPNITVMEPVAMQFKELEPDVVITCVYDCAPWMQALRKVNFSPNAQVRCTYITIDQVEVTNAVLLSQIDWMFGAEMGANEHGVVIGNEAIWTKDDCSSEPKYLLGMDRCD